MSKYGDRTINWFEAVVNKLGGAEAAERFLRGELRVVERGSARLEQGAAHTDIWKTITLGIHKTAEEYRKALEKAGVRIGDNANNILEKTLIASTPCEIHLVIRSVADLGFTDQSRDLRKNAFNLKHDNRYDRWLYARYGGPSGLWDPENRLVFALRPASISP